MLVLPRLDYFLQSVHCEGLRFMLKKSYPWACGRVVVCKKGHDGV